MPEARHPRLPAIADRLQVVIAMVSTLVLVSPARPDITSPGMRQVVHFVTIEGLERFPEHVFVAWPTAISAADSKPLKIRSGVPFTFYKMVNPRILALGRAGPDLDRRTYREIEQLAVPRSDPIHVRVMVPSADPTVKITRVLRIDSVGPQRIGLVDVREEREYEPLGLLVSSPWFHVGVSGLAFAILVATALHRARGRRRPSC